MKILTLGPKYSFSHLASTKYVEKIRIDAEIELLVPINKTEGIIEELIKRYKQGENIMAIVPVLNTIEGRVKDTIGPGRGLIKYPEVQICGEYWLKIEHCLAGKGKIENVTKVISHEQALGQCSQYLQNLNVKIEKVESTSKAAELASRDKRGEIAAICSESAAIGYDLNILARDIGNKFENSENWTRFFVLSNKDADQTGKDKSTLTMELYGADKPGTLAEALSLFSVFNTNLSYIESMVKGSREEFIFWIDADKHRKELEWEIAGLKRLTKWLNVHGSYPMDFK
jgi:chorismate mutase/prephenate dehydratase